MKSGLAATAICAAAALVLRLAVELTSTTDQAVARPGSSKMLYKLSLDDPGTFLKEYLPRIFAKPPSEDLFAEDTIDTASIVRVQRGSRMAEMQVELISSVEMREDEYYIRLLGAPARLEESYSLAMRLCDIAEIPDKRIVKWRNEEQYRNVLTRTQAARGRDQAGRRHTVEIRNSYEEEKPWRVNYTIYFSTGERKRDILVLPEQAR